MKTGDADPPLVQYANYIDSMLVLAEFATDTAYEFLLRSDLDTFVTPGFSDWILQDDVAIATGKGGYVCENVNRHLSWTMTNKLRLTDGGLLGLVSTWYGRSRVMIASAKLTIAAMTWLHTQEFNEYEQFHSGTDSWPFWHWPVLLLYGGHIALNQIPVTRFAKSSNGEFEVDYGTGSDSLMGNTTKHLHCFQGREVFSKLSFHDGFYANLDITQYTAMDTSQSYYTVLAVSSARLSITEISAYVADKAAMERCDRKRLKSPV